MHSYRWKVAAIILIALAALGSERAANSEHQPPGPLAGKHICLDPGHGGSDPGAVNGALLEKENNLKVATLLRDMLENAHATVTMTREGDVTLSTRDRYEGCNASAADAAASIHTNSVSSPDPNYTLIIYFHNDDRVLAEALLESLGSLIAEPTAAARIRKDAFGFVLKTDMPAVTVEPLFMSNPAEAAALLACFDGTAPDCPRQQEIADAIFAGLEAYFAAGPDPDGNGRGNGKGGGNGKGKKPG